MSYKVLVFGAGDAGRRLIYIVKQDIVDIMGFIDNDQLKQGKKFYNKPVISPNEIKSFKYDFIVIASQNEKEIREQLISLGVSKKEIISFLNVEDAEQWSALFKPYANISPGATYSPWFEDQEFLKKYDKVKCDTLVDIYRCYELWMLVKQYGLVDGNMLEVGVYKGGTAGIICSAAQLCNKNIIVYLADTFSGVVKAGVNDSIYRGGEHGDTDVEHVEHLLKDELYLQNYRILKGTFPEETHSLVDSKSISFCHIDVDVYDSAKDITEWLWDKLVVGGMIVYDDYGWELCDGVTKYLNEQKTKADRRLIYNLNGHGILIKIQ